MSQRVTEWQLALNNLFDALLFAEQQRHEQAQADGLAPIRPEEPVTAEAYIAYEAARGAYVNDNQRRANERNEQANNISRLASICHDLKIPTEVRFQVPWGWVKLAARGYTSHQIAIEAPLTATPTKEGEQA